MSASLEAWVQSGRVADLLIAVLAIEAIVLVGLRLFGGRGFAVRHVVSNLLAGLFLVLALRLALTDAPWTYTALCLAAAGIAHVADLAVRWPAKPH